MSQREDEVRRRLGMPSLAPEDFVGAFGQPTVENDQFGRIVTALTAINPPTPRPAEVAKAPVAAQDATRVADPNTPKPQTSGMDNLRKMIALYLPEAMKHLTEKPVDENKAPAQSPTGTMAPDERSIVEKGLQAGRSAVDPEYKNPLIKFAEMLGLTPNTVMKDPFSVVEGPAVAGVKFGLGIAKGIDEAAENAPMFYSRVKKAIEDSPQEKAFGGQWLARLKDTWKGERDWTGIEDYLKANVSKPLTKQQVLDEIAKKDIRITETVLKQGKGELPEFGWLETPGGNYVVKTKTEDDWYDLGEAKSTFIRSYNGSFEVITPAGMVIPYPTLEAAQESANNYVKSYAAGRTIDTTRHKGYTEPGGEDYQETLVQLDRSHLEEVEKANYEQIAELSNKQSLLRERLKTDPNPEGNSVLLDEIDSLQEQIDDLVNQAQFLEVEDFRVENHFGGTPNIAVSLRSKIRQSPDGAKNFFLEEIQSDWGQQGRKYGFKKFGAYIPRLKGSSSGANFGSFSTKEEAIEGMKARGFDPERFDYQFDAHTTIGEIPDTPFKDTDEWTSLGLKRALAEAVKTGSDRLSWTNGAQQARRYDLDKVLSELSYNPTTGQLRGKDLDGESNIARKVSPEGLTELVGKEVAEKLLAQPRKQFKVEYVDRFTDSDGTVTMVRKPWWNVVDEEGKSVIVNNFIETEEIAIKRAEELNSKATHILKGEALKVEQRGMRKYYDEIVPKTMEKVLKKLGIKDVKVEQIDMEFPKSTVWHDGQPADEVNTEKVWSIKITPEIREKIKKYGQSFGAVAMGFGLSEGIKAGQSAPDSSKPIPQ